MDNGATTIKTESGATLIVPEKYFEAIMAFSNMLCHPSGDIFLTSDESMAQRRDYILGVAIKTIKNINSRTISKVHTDCYFNTDKRIYTFELKIESEIPE